MRTMRRYQQSCHEPPRISDGAAIRIRLQHDSLSTTPLLAMPLTCGSTHQGNVCSAVSATISLTGINPQLNLGSLVQPRFNDYNLCTGGAVPCSRSPSSHVSATPTYAGGSNPSTYAGFALTSTSLGHNAGNDGKDIGINVTAGSPSTSHCNSSRPARQIFRQLCSRALLGWNSEGVPVKYLRAP